MQNMNVLNRRLNIALQLAAMGIHIPVGNIKERGPKFTAPKVGNPVKRRRRQMAKQSRKINRMKARGLF